MNPHDNIKIVLVNTSHPGNIGSAARAMKTMGLKQLVLVSPEKFPHSEATALAVGADDLLVNAQVVETLEEAIADCQLILATSARDRTHPWPMLTPKEAGRQVVKEASKAKVAIVFGRERSGLTNDELQVANFHVQIPSVPEYFSLNLAQAVQIISYEVRLASLEEVSHEDTEDRCLSVFATSDELERLYVHFESVLLDVGFLEPNRPMHCMSKIRRMYNRSRLEGLEVKLMRGILTAIQNKMRD
jgi:tRNA (cytidine32/uridine32-2'-O)-methyltransferase